jgi:hypothetical protein
MRQHPAQTPCLGERVSALADGSLRDDVRDRALAHTLTCPACRDALDVERLTLERLRTLPDVEPSARLMTALLALGETGGPVRPRRGAGPGMPLPVPVSLGPAATRTTPPSTSGPVRPGGSTHPGRRVDAGRRTRRTLVVAAAGAIGAGFVAAGVLTSAASGALTPPTTRAPAAHLTLNGGVPAARTGPRQQTYQPAGFVPAVVVTSGTSPLSVWSARNAASPVTGGMASGVGSAVPRQVALMGALEVRHR